MLRVVGTRAFVLLIVVQFLLVQPAKATSIIDTIGLGGNPTGMAVNVVTNTLHVANNNGTLQAINMATNAVASSVPISGASAVAVNPNTNTIYVTGGEGVSVVN